MSRGIAAAPEWPTLALIAGVWLAFGGVTWFWQVLGWWLVVPVGAYLVCLHGSLCHEAVHGHPTRCKWLNELLVFPPVSLWYPYRRYGTHHLRHHNDAHLTDPHLDPESRYLDPQAWRTAPAWLKVLLKANNSVAGRLLLGPAISTAALLRGELAALRQNEDGCRRAWALHLSGCAVVWFWVSAVCGMPFWQYVLLVAYPGNSLTLLRSYAEHRAHETASCRTVIVESNPVVGLMYLNNNLHMAHHEHPRLAWYALPAYYRQNRARLISQNCAYVFSGYGQIVRRWLLRPKEPVPHPSSR